MVEIRPLQANDRAEWLRMRVALWPAPPLADLAEEVNAHLAGQPRGNPPLAAVFVSVAGPGRLNGFLELSIRGYAEGCAGPVPYVEGWYVDGDARGEGFGSALMAAAEDWARERGYREMASDAELENTVSHRAHESLGFEEVERAVHYRKAL